MVKYGSEEHRKRQGEAGSKTRALKRATGLYMEASRKGWEGFNIEQRSQRTEAARAARKANLVDHPRTEYGGDWPEVRARILERDGYECRLVTLHGNRPVGKRLEVHHLCYEADCRNENHLVTLCSRCHQGGHRRRSWPVILGAKEKPGVR